MKLYRGLKKRKYEEFDKKTLDEYAKGWKKILSLRKEGNFEYPHELDNLIKRLFKIQPLVMQNFTDNRLIAENYVKKEGGILIEIDVPIQDIIEKFVLEFQNYPKRKKKFEIVYAVKGSEILSNSKKWKLKKIEY